MTNQHILAELEQNRIRPSVQRVRVLEYLHQIEGHPTAEDIYAALAPEIPSLSRTTIYNTLHTFVGAGMVRVVAIDSDESRYDLTLHDHGHFKCTSCGEITNFEIDIEAVPAQGLSHFLIQEKNVFYRGLCPNCLNQPKR